MDYTEYTILIVRQTTIGERIVLTQVSLHL